MYDAINKFAPPPITSVISQPVEGYYSTRLASGGIEVGVRFWRDSGGVMRVEVDGRATRRVDGTDVPLDPYEVWPWCAGRSISQQEFEHRERRRQWAVEHAADHPAANPRERIDLNRLPPRY